MINNRLKLLTLFLLGFCMAGLTAQEAIPASGGEADGNGGTVSYSVGQLLYQTHTGNGGSVAQGVQQPYEILKLTGIGSHEGINLHYMVYPNPVTDDVRLSVDNHSLDGLSYQLYNLKGELLESGEIVGELTRIHMSTLGAATYVIRVTRDSEEITAFKIIKK